MYGADDFLVGGINGLEGLAIDTFDPFIVDETRLARSVVFFGLAITERKEWSVKTVYGGKGNEQSGRYFEFALRRFDLSCERHSERLYLG